MKIAYNPTTAAALTAAPQNNDITFDLKGVAVYARGVKFKGTDTTYSVFKKHTSESNTGGHNGLVPVPSYTTTQTRYLREDGTWVVPTNTTYAVVSSTANGLAPKIGTAAAATIATQADEWVLTSTKGGTPTWRKLPTNAFKNDNTTYTLSGTLSSNNYTVTLTPSSGSATTATIPVMTGATSSAAGKAGLVPVPAANKHTSFLRGDGTWVVPADTHYTTHLYIGAKDAASNAATTNGNTYIKVTDNSTIRNQYIIKGSGNTSVSSDASGNITINSPTTLSWDKVSGKPSTFTPSSHTHPTSAISALTGYTKATSAAALSTSDTLNVALGKLEYKAHYAYDWVIGVTATDSDEYINKWSEIVGFLDSVKEGTDILDEFVTRKTAQDITGQKRFITSTNEKPLIICRNAGTTEALKIGVTDNQAIFDYDNDEKTCSFVFKMTNTDIENSDGSGANTSQVTFVGSASGSTITADTLAGKLNNTLTFSAGTFSAKTYNNSAKVTVAIPTHTSHLTNNSGFLTQHQSLANYVTLNTAQTITGLKTFQSNSNTTGISLVLKNSGWYANMSTAMDFYNGDSYTVPNARIETKMVGNGNAGGTLIFYTQTKHASTNPNPNGLTERLRIDDNGVTKVTGALTVTGNCDFSGGTVKFDTINIPTSSGGTTLGPGSNGQVLKSNGSTVYWASDNNSNTWRAIQANGTQIASTGTGTYALNFVSGTGITVAGTAGTSSAANKITITNAGVRSAAINGNYLRVNTNGTNADLTIPYATTATTASKLSTVSKTAWGQTYWTSGGIPTNISGDMTGVGNITISAGNEDKYITFNYTGGTGYDWRIGYLGSGGGDANYFVIQSDKTDGTYVNALRIGLTTLNAVFSSSVTATSFIGSLNNTLTFAAGTFSAKTYNNGSAVTVNIPTKVSHLTNDLGYITSYTDTAAGKTFKTLSSASHSGWTNNATDNKIIPTMSFIAYWNGAYSSGGASNLAYCDRGRFGTIITKNVGDYAAASHTHSYLPLSGGTLTGKLTLSYSTSADMTTTSSNPQIVFAESGTQPVQLMYTDYDNYRSPAGLKVLGSQGGEWFEVVGNIYGAGFVKSGSSDSYVLLGGGGHKTISSLSVNYASSAGNADKVDGYHIAVQSSAGTNASTIYFVI